MVPSTWPPRQEQETPTATIEEKVAQLQHLLAAHEAAQVLKHELMALAKASPEFWDAVVSDAERISSRLRSVISDTGAVITGKVRP